MASTYRTASRHATESPAFRKASMASEWPPHAAHVMAVHPDPQSGPSELSGSAITCFRFAPAFTRRRIVGALPAKAAASRGVQSRNPFTLGSAPFARSFLTDAESPFDAA